MSADEESGFAGRGGYASLAAGIGLLGLAFLSEHPADAHPPYLPLQGPSFQEWLDNLDALGVRIHADRMFTFHLADSHEPA